MEAGLQLRLSLPGCVTLTINANYDTKPTSLRCKDQYPSLGTFGSRGDILASHGGIMKDFYLKGTDLCSLLPPM